jgi:transcription initiation factor TFIID subunit 15
MGDIPSKNNMISAIITFPEVGTDVEADTTFDITVQVSNLEAGSFTNAQETYYSAPQALQNGNIVGHTHVTVQDMGNNLNPTQPLDPTVFVFFKGINDAGDGNGGLSATVTGGLPAGNYRVCSMTSASNHQPVLMPVAQRGAQDDCTKFTVGAGNAGK